MLVAVASKVMFVSPCPGYLPALSLIGQVYDFLLRFDREFSFVLETKWTLVKFIFLLSRYTPFIDLAVIVYRKDPS